MKRLIVAASISIFTFLAAPGVVLAQGSNTAAPQGQGSREFMLSATYGALAGSIVGAASLAFSEKPGNSLNKVARGASIGLYAGILLGLYVTYGGPSQDDEEIPVGLYKEPKFMIAPVLTERGVEGAEARYSVVEF